MATEKQLEANRRNALRSTGPRSVEGKAASRANSTKHGLTSMVVQDDQYEQAKMERLKEWVPCVNPTNPFQRYQLVVAVRASLEMDKCDRSKAKRRSELAFIATDDEATWVTAKWLEADDVAKRLKRDPKATVAKLKTTAKGREWLLDAWKELLVGVSENEAGYCKWTEDESNRFLDLLGKPLNYRDIEIDSRPFRNRHEIRRLILEQIESLEALREKNAQEFDRLKDNDAEGLNFTDKDLRLIHRYEKEAKRDFYGSLAVIEKNKLGLAAACPELTQDRGTLPTIPQSRTEEISETNPISVTPVIPTMPALSETNPISELEPAITAEQTDPQELCETDSPYVSSCGQPVWPTLMLLEECCCGPEKQWFDVTPAVQDSTANSESGISTISQPDEISETNPISEKNQIPATVGISETNPISETPPQPRYTAPVYNRQYFSELDKMYRSSLDLFSRRSFTPLRIDGLETGSACLDIAAGAHPCAPNGSASHSNSRKSARKQRKEAKRQALMAKLAEKH